MLLFFYGLTIRRNERREWLAEWWLLAVFIYILVVNKGNQVHEYYQLPFIPAAAIIVGRAWAKLVSLADPGVVRVRRLALTVLILFGVSILILSGLRYASLLSGENDTSLTDFARQASSIIPQDEMVLDVDDGNPVTLYLLHRKGWILNCNSIASLAKIPNYVVLHRTEPHHYGCAEFSSMLQHADTLLMRGDHVLLRTKAGSLQR